MRIFGIIKSLAGAVHELQRIANAMEFIALNVARKEHMFFNTTNKKRPLYFKDESELLHTNDEEINKARQEEFERFLQHGIPDDIE